uniref:Uncharacterized protein n=1 Tax=Haemonchus contortus TaxID=6289 RepID=A0A7I4YKL3_HAECO
MEPNLPCVLMEFPQSGLGYWKFCCNSKVQCERCRSNNGQNRNTYEDI